MTFSILREEERSSEGISAFALSENCSQSGYALGMGLLGIEVPDRM